MSNYIKWPCLIALGMFTFALGLLRQNYIINIVDYSSPFLMNRNIFLDTGYPFTFSSLCRNLFSDPRWISSILYLCYPIISTLLAIYLLFNKKKYILISLSFYAIGILLLTVMVVFSILFNNYNLGYGLAQYVKKIFQEPYISLLLLGGFYWDMQNRVEK